MSISNIPYPESLPETEKAISAALKAGNEIMSIYQNGFDSEIKDDNSPITKADINSNRIILDVLSETNIPILSEEENDEIKRLEFEKIWIVDPLDGTSDFIQKTGEFTVMIALVYRNEPIMGVINCPAQKSIFFAEKGKGAYKFSDNSWRKIHVSNQNELKQAKAVGSRNHLTEKEKEILEQLEISNFQSKGSSLKVTDVASGIADVYFTTTDKMKQWDTCASAILIQEAGGKFTDLLNQEIKYNVKELNHENGLLFSNNILHEKILEIIKKKKN